TLNFGSPSLVSLRVSVSPFAAIDPLKAGGSETLQKALQKNSKRDANLLNRTYLLSTGWDTNTLPKVHKLEMDFWQCRNARMPVQVTESKEPVTIRVLPRGNWQAENGEIVEPHPLAFLPQLPNPDGHRLT